MITTKQYVRDRRQSLNDVAASVVKRLNAMRALAAETNQQAPASELALQFKIICERARPYGGPVTTSEMELIAVELIPRLAA